MKFVLTLEFFDTVIFKKDKVFIEIDRKTRFHM